MEFHEDPRTHITGKGVILASDALDKSRSYRGQSPKFSMKLGLDRASYEKLMASVGPVVEAHAAEMLDDDSIDPITDKAYNSPVKEIEPGKSNLLPDGGYTLALTRKDWGEASDQPVLYSNRASKATAKLPKKQQEPAVLGTTPDSRTKAVKDRFYPGAEALAVVSVSSYDRSEDVAEGGTGAKYGWQLVLHAVQYLGEGVKPAAPETADAPQSAFGLTIPD